MGLTDPKSSDSAEENKDSLLSKVGIRVGPFGDFPSKTLED